MGWHMHTMTYGPEQGFQNQKRMTSRIQRKATVSLWIYRENILSCKALGKLSSVVNQLPYNAQQSEQTIQKLIFKGKNTDFLFMVDFCNLSEDQLSFPPKSLYESGLHSPRFSLSFHQNGLLNSLCSVTGFPSPEFQNLSHLSHSSKGLGTAQSGLS